jgi:hypothetical protein
MFRSMKKYPENPKNLGKFPEIDRDMNNPNKYLDLMKRILEPSNK